MPQIFSRKGRLLLLAVFLLTIVVACISPMVEWFTYRTSIRQWKSASLSHNVPINSQFEKLWSLAAFIRCKSCLISTENNVYFSGSLENNSPEFLVSLDLLTGGIEWQQMLRKFQTLEGLNSKHIYISQSATQKIAGPTQLWGAAQIIAYDIESFEEVWRQQFAGSWGVSINRIVENMLVIDAGPGLYHVNTDTGQKIDGPQQQDLLSAREEIQYLRTYDAGPVLRSVNIESGEIVWDHDLPSFPQFVFEDELILIGNAVSGELGGAAALDGNTGETLWNQRRVISNIAVSNGVVYFIKLEEGVWGQDLALDAQLMAVDIRTGETLGTLHFEPSGIRSGSGHYEYLVTASDNIVLVYLGDGRQLIALRFLTDK